MQLSNSQMTVAASLAFSSTWLVGCGGNGGCQQFAYNVTDPATNEVTPAKASVGFKGNEDKCCQEVQIFMQKVDEIDLTNIPDAIKKMLNLSSSFPDATCREEPITLSNSVNGGSCSEGLTTDQCTTDTITVPLFGSIQVDLYGFSEKCCTAINAKPPDEKAINASCSEPTSWCNKVTVDLHIGSAHETALTV